MPEKVKVAIEDIAYCGGCEVAIADLGKDLVGLLVDKIDLVYAPVLMSARDYGPVDIAVIIGAARSEHDITLIRKARENAKVLIAFGACSCFGGIPSLANLYIKEELLKTAYVDAPSIEEKSKAVVPRVNVPELAEKVSPVSKYVKVDFFLPGCPPPPPLIKDVLLTLLKKLGV